MSHRTLPCSCENRGYPDFLASLRNPRCQPRCPRRTSFRLQAGSSGTSNAVHTVCPSHPPSSLRHEEFSRLLICTKYEMRCRAHPIRSVPGTEVGQIRQTHMCASNGNLSRLTAMTAHYIMVFMHTIRCKLRAGRQAVGLLTSPVKWLHLPHISSLLCQESNDNYRYLH